MPNTKYLVILLIVLGGCAVLLLGAEGEPDGADLDRAAGSQRPRDCAARVCVLPSVCDNESDTPFAFCIMLLTMLC